MKTKDQIIAEIQTLELKLSELEKQAPSTAKRNQPDNFPKRLKVLRMIQKLRDQL